SDLQLWVNYEEKEGMRTVDLYKKSPVIFKLKDSSADIEPQVFKIKIKDNNSFYLKNGEGKSQVYFFNDTLRNIVRLWKIIPTSNLEKFIGTEIKVSTNNPDKVAEQYQTNIAAEQANKLASTINLTLKDEVEQRGKDVLNDLISLYNETSIAEKNRITKRTLDFIDERIGSLADELNTSEKNIEGYRSSRGITDISSQSQVYLQNVQANDSKLNEVNVQLNVIDGIDKYLNSPQNLQYAPSTLGITDPLLNSSIEKVSQLQLQREKLLATTPETNPDFESIDRQLKTTKRAVKENIDNIKSSLLLTKNKLESFNSNYESSIRNVPTQERQLVDKTRQQSIKENLYVYLLQKREEVALNYSSILSDARVIDYAYATSKSSKKPIVYGAAFLLGIVLPAGFIYGRSALSNKVTTAKEIEDGTGTPIFAELSYANISSPLIIPNENNLVIGEDFRKLRTNLSLLKDKQEKGWVTLITSSISDEGKCFVSTNLGYFLALSGKKTIILEMDWRRPKISGIFKLSNDGLGISDYLTGECTADQIIHKSKINPNLDVIASGKLLSNPAELFESDKIDSLMNFLRLHYDYIIIDSPPVNFVTDAKILARFNHTVLCIIRQSYTYKSLLPFIKSLSKESNFANMKIIFNGVVPGKYGYEYNYGKNYYKSLNSKRFSGITAVFRDIYKRF
ncbi:MAG: polysaccharide biosynthesis tyrosine autokinase, partial [Thermoproteota archaeon]|nr:polysaccharide biosynthesis tyrosine autokinase [Thermoproteota archaeon]